MYDVGDMVTVIDTDGAGSSWEELCVGTRGIVLSLDDSPLSHIGGLAAVRIVAGPYTDRVIEMYKFRFKRVALCPMEAI